MVRRETKLIKRAPGILPGVAARPPGLAGSELAKRSLPGLPAFNPRARFLGKPR